MPQALMDYWDPKLIEKGIQRVLEGDNYTEAWRHLFQDARDLKVRKPRKVAAQTYRRYLKPLVEQASRERGRVLATTDVEIIPPKRLSAGQHRAEALALEKIRVGTPVQVAWVNQTYGALFNEVLERYQEIRDDPESPGSGMQALEALRRVVNDMAAAAGVGKLHEASLVQIIVGLPSEQLPPHLVKAVEEKIRSEVIADLLGPLKKVLCRNCVRKLAKIHSSS